MSGIHGQAIGHLVRRGIQAATNPNEQRIQQLQVLAQKYEEAGPAMEVKPWEVLPVVITGIVFMLLLASVCIPTARLCLDTSY